MKKVVILGATGSIGKQALDIIKNNPNEFELVKISIGNNVKQLLKILEDFETIKEVAILDKEFIEDLEYGFNEMKFYDSSEGILKLLDNDDYDIVLNGIVGFAGLLPSIKTIEHNKILALANKETMVVAGKLVNEKLKAHPQARIIPVDSEHCAIFQCLENNQHRDIKRLILSASGGSFKDKSLEELKNVSIEEALNHPNWNMGNSITIDSATMLNKALEIIEAHFLFNVSYDQIEVVIQPQSIVHSMVEYKDSSILAQLSYPDMRQPILYGLSYPKRLEFKENSLDFSQPLTLNFEPVDLTRFEAINLAFMVGRLGNSYPCVLNASKEEATNAFLKGEIGFLTIIDLVKNAIKNHKIIEDPSIEVLIKIDELTRKYVRSLIEKESVNGNN